MEELASFPEEHAETKPDSQLIGETEIDAKELHPSVSGCNMMFSEEALDAARRADDSVFESSHNGA
jgi:hypothetical protein